MFLNDSPALESAGAVCGGGQKLNNIGGSALFSIDNADADSTGADFALATLAAGDVAGKGGVLRNSGCRPVRYTITTLTGRTSDPCKADTIVPEVKTIDVEPNGSVKLPDGVYWSGITAQTLDAEGEPAVMLAGEKDVTASVSSLYSENNAECVMLVPA